MKYLLIRDGATYDVEPVIFPSYLSHKGMWESLQSLVPTNSTVESAGFVDMTDEEFSVWGHSESLGIESRPQDASTIDAHFQ